MYLYSIGNFCKSGSVAGKGLKILTDVSKLHCYRNYHNSTVRVHVSKRF